MITSACLTVTDLPCVFPFVYKNETYNACTGVDSDNGAKWCATEVDSETRETVQNAGRTAASPATTPKDPDPTGGTGATWP